MTDNTRALIECLKEALKGIVEPIGYECFRDGCDCEGNDKGKDLLKRSLEAIAEAEKT